MPDELTPAGIFHRAAQEGRRRLDQAMPRLVATGFIAGFTIIFGIVAFGIAHAAVEPRFGEMAKLAGALAFAPGVVLLVIGRAELFSENFFDPVATMFERRERALLPRLLRLWGVTFILNMVGGALLALVVAVPGVLSEASGSALRTIAEETAASGAWAGFASAILGGALIALLSFILQAADSTMSRIALAFLVGFLLAMGPFVHVVVTVLHVFLGILVGAGVSYGALFMIMGVATAGNLVGGVGLVTLSHAAQALGGEQAGD